MTEPRTLPAPLKEVLDHEPVVAVDEREYQRLLGLPPSYEPGERVQELNAQARAWYTRHGRPWVYLREAELQLEAAPRLRIGGQSFESPQLHAHLQQGGATRVLLLVASAGRGCEEHARELWEEGKPDEYFFLEMFGSAVVEHLVATASGRLCERAAGEGLLALRHYSPGYTGWDIRDQNRLFELISSGRTLSWPEPLEVLSSGMLRPKKALLAVIGLAPASAATRVDESPCVACALPRCDYRRAPYRHRRDTSPTANAGRAAGAAPRSYTVNRRALQRWSRERVRFSSADDGVLEARFRYDGTTCSNQGQPLAFDYEVALRPEAEGYRIVRTRCAPASQDLGYQQMCAYVADPEGLMREIGVEQPLLGRRLDEIFSWSRPSDPAGCYCQPTSRAHKWGLALEVIHFALQQQAPASDFSPDRRVPPASP